jgi:exopolysaccharide biosynthesis polyprenyl glycosylphosphotransferase
VSNIELIPDKGAVPARRPAIIPRVHLPGLRISERLLLLAVVDVFFIVGSLALAIRIRTDWLDSPGALFVLWRWWITLIAVWWVLAQLWDAYDLARVARAPNSILAASAAAGLAALAYQMIPVVTPPLGSRGLSLLFILLAISSVAVWRGLYAVLFSQPGFETRALVFGAGSSGAALANALSSACVTSSPSPYHGTRYCVVGFIDDDPEKRSAGSVAGAPVLGGSAEIERLAREVDADEVVLAITRRDTIHQGAFDALLACHERGFRVTTMEAVYERVLGRVPVDHLGRNIAAAFPVEEGGATERLYWAVKRAFDILGALFALIPLGLLVPVVAIMNAADNPGPLFYLQTRLGKGGQPFQIRKFRTMRPNAEALTGAVWAQARDARVPPVGQFLRRSRIDELPQVLNVLRGEMSLIGPRPERPEFVEQLADAIPFYKARHAVKPGLTGWAQVRFGYCSSLEHARVKLEYDLYYVRHAGFYLDALIALKTAAVVFRLQGR